LPWPSSHASRLGDETITLRVWEPSATNGSPSIGKAQGKIRDGEDPPSNHQVSLNIDIASHVTASSVAAKIDTFNQLGSSEC